MYYVVFCRVFRAVSSSLTIQRRVIVVLLRGVPANGRPGEREIYSSQSKLDGKYSLESTDPRKSEIRAPPQPLSYLMPISINTLFYNK